MGIFTLPGAGIKVLICSEGPTWVKLIIVSILKKRVGRCIYIYIQTYTHSRESSLSARWARERKLKSGTEGAREMNEERDRGRKGTSLCVYTFFRFFLFFLLSTLYIYAYIPIVVACRADLDLRFRVRYLYSCILTHCISNDDVCAVCINIYTGSIYMRNETLTCFFEKRTTCVVY